MRGYGGWDVLQSKRDAFQYLSLPTPAHPLCSLSFGRLWGVGLFSAPLYDPTLAPP